MAALGELKRAASALFVSGEVLQALRLYDAIVAAQPMDFEARLKVGDCLAGLGESGAAAEVYRSVAWYCLKSGHPLAALVAARVLESLGQEAADLLAALVVRYGSESEFVGKRAARIRLPEPSLETPGVDLQAPPSPELVSQAAARAVHCLDDFDGYPDAIHPIPLLSELSEDAFRAVLKTVVVRRLPPGSLVVREGELGQSFYFVATGEVRVYATDGLGRETDLATLQENAIFGEMALLSAQPRSASVAVIGEADLLELTKSSLGAAADELESVATALHRFTRDRLLKNLMRKHPLFRPFSQSHRLDLLRRFTSHDVAPDTDIIVEGDDGHGLFVVLSGEVEVRKDAPGGSKPLATLRAGEVFGEMAVLKGGKTSATVTASTPSTVLFLARENVQRIVSRVPEIRDYLASLAEDRALETKLTLSDEELGEDDVIILI